MCKLPNCEYYFLVECRKTLIFNFSNSNKLPGVSNTMIKVQFKNLQNVDYSTIKNRAQA